MRAANIIQQKADVLYCYGARLDEQQVAFSYENFVSNGLVSVLDIDQAELDKLPDRFLKGKFNLSKLKVQNNDPVDPAWLTWCRALYARFRPELDGVDNPKFVDPFRFISLLSDHAQPTDILAMGSSGTAPNTFLQAFKIKRGQRFVNAGTMGLMGADIPMAIGACLAGGNRTLCATGDGGFMLNVQELEVIRRLNLPIKFFVYNNNGYASIRNMQNARFGGFHVACDRDSGLTLPRIADRGTDYGGLADAFGIQSSVAYTAADVELFLNSPYFTGSSPFILELMIDPKYEQFPKVVNRMVNNEFIKTPMQEMTPPIPDLDELMKWGNDD